MKSEKQWAKKYRPALIKNCKSQSPANKKLKDETGKNSITQKDLKQRKYIIKRMRVKIKIKNKLEGNQNFSIGGLNWKEN